MKSGGNTENCREDAAVIEDNKLTASGGRVNVKPKMKKTSKSQLAPMRTGWWGSLGNRTDGDLVETPTLQQSRHKLHKAEGSIKESETT
ncbi:hypothetical protein Goklo_010048 [Gossypium klotzschianum]|uniref:Uncharacterized protein n=1 Tax=Gossypium klotzschianum TaxID=34286 RepID=A0A7J8V4W7_9ROSI|nr:hypothetical protein [Gossypium klotzschianum]